MYLKIKRIIEEMYSRFSQKQINTITSLINNMKTKYEIATLINIVINDYRRKKRKKLSLND